MSNLNNINLSESNTDSTDNGGSIMRVKNRNGVFEELSFDEIMHRINRLVHHSNECKQLSNINVAKITLDTINKLYDGITTRQLDVESAKVCASMESINPNYGLLGGRILISDLHKHLKKMGLSDYASRTNYISANLKDYLNPTYVEFVKTYAEQLNKMISYDRDLNISYFGVKTLEKSYLIKVGTDVIETPQDMFMRVAVAIHYRSLKDDISNLDKVMELISNTYNLTSLGDFTHATPTLFNAGTRFEQISSCYLLGTED